MDIIKQLQEDEDLSGLLSDICDVIILLELKSPQDEFGHLTYSMTGKTFAKEGSGNEFILLEDGSVGFWGSDGKSGRIAENLQDFFTFIINCPFWHDYTNTTFYENEDSIQDVARELTEEYEQMLEEDMEIDLHESQQELAEHLKIPLYSNITDMLKKFHQSATREPRLITTYTENDGSVHSSAGSLFEK